MIDQKIKLSFFSRWWVRWVVPKVLRDTAPDEWEEVYREIAIERGRPHAILWLLGQGVLTRRDIFIDQSKGGWFVLTTLFKRVFQPYKKNDLYTWINTIGLAVGLCAAMVILLWTGSEQRFEEMHVKRDRIYRIIEHFQFSGSHTAVYAMIPGIFGPAMPGHLPEVVRSVRYRPGGEVAVLTQGKTFREWKTAIADTGFFDMFSFSLIHGDASQALKAPDALVLSRRAAVTLFGSTDVLGERLEIAGEGNFYVSAVMETPPQETHLQFDLLVPFKKARRMGVPAQQFLFYETFLELREGVDLAHFREKIYPMFKVIAPGAPADVTMDVQSLNDVHLHSRFDIDVAGHGSAEQVRVLGFVALLIMGIACINFINLSTARASRRSREVGLRKTLGGTRQGLWLQFMGEAAANVLCSGAAALLLAALLLPWINGLIGKSFLLVDLFTPAHVFKVAGMLILTAVGAGLYPAWVLSSFTPLHALKQGRLAGGQKKGFRWTLVVAQFVLATGLWVLTWIAGEQVAYMSARAPGYNRSQLVALALDETAKTQRPLLKQRIANLPGVLGVSATSETPVNLSRATDHLDWDGKSPNDVHLFNLMFCDGDAAETLGLTLTDGRFFAEDRQADEDHYVMNETAVRVMGMDVPVGQRFVMWERPGRIIGVVKDFHFQSMHQSIQPLIMKYNPDRTETLLLRMAPGAGTDILAAVQVVWKDVLPDTPFTPHYLTSEFRHLHAADRRFGTLFSVFSSLALGVSCLGLLGLAAFLVEQRTREMGIRRVLGASGQLILRVMTGEFILGILIANVLAAPLAWWAGTRWLQRFAYHIDIGPGPFLLSLGLSVGLAFIVSSGQALKLIRMNPVKTLRQE